MKKINESFICINCGKHVTQAAKTCRNHCPYCFVSLHVDDTIPGDRNTECRGKMYPIAYEIRNGQLKICFQCKICKKLHRNKRTDDDKVEKLDEYIKLYKELIY
ncbi:MAG TPA: RNHCP domain-containing protein [Candidatus Absconditabacterales bacterium]|nr:RNHCP domain-containing protein [Candidatus Absconditabacterales bacterium]